MSGQDEPSFWRDLRFSLAAWQRMPWLPAISVILFLLTCLLPDPLWFVALPVLVLSAGWVGTERICYLRALKSRPIAAGELWRLTLAFVMRYATLGLGVGLLYAPLFAWTATQFREGDAFVAGTAFLVVSSVVSIAIDVCLTFVTPALAFTTKRVRHALWLGLRMIRSEWPGCLWYVLVPPFAILIVLQLLGRGSDFGVGVRFASSIVSALLNLWFKGATAAFYVRRGDLADEVNGAAFLPRFPVRAEAERGDVSRGPTA